MSKNLMKNKIHKIRKSKSFQLKQKWPIDLQKKHSMNEHKPKQRYNFRKSQDHLKNKKRINVSNIDIENLQQKLRLQKIDNQKPLQKHDVKQVDKKYVINSIKQNNQENLFFKTKRHSYVFPIYEKKSKKITVPKDYQNAIIPLENDEDYDTDDELVEKAILKVQKQLKELILTQK